MYVEGSTVPNIERNVVSALVLNLIGLCRCALLDLDGSRFRERHVDIEVSNRTQKMSVL